MSKEEEASGKFKINVTLIHHGLYWNFSRSFSVLPPPPPHLRLPAETKRRRARDQHLFLAIFQDGNFWPHFIRSTGNSVWSPESVWRQKVLEGSVRKFTYSFLEVLTHALDKPFHNYLDVHERQINYRLLSSCLLFRKIRGHTRMLRRTQTRINYVIESIYDNVASVYTE